MDDPNYVAVYKVIYEKVIEKHIDNKQEIINVWLAAGWSLSVHEAENNFR